MLVTVIEHNTLSTKKYDYTKMVKTKYITGQIDKIQLHGLNLSWGEDKTLNNQVFNWIPPGRRKRGKPKPTWKLEMLTTMGKRDIKTKILCVWNHGKKNTESLSWYTKKSPVKNNSSMVKVLERHALFLKSNRIRSPVHINTNNLSF